MEFDEVAAKRISVRAYQNREVEDKSINEIIACGHKAPSAGNVKPWEFIVVRNKTIIADIVDTTYSGSSIKEENPQKWLLTAPVLIVVCANKPKSFKKYGEEAIKTLIYLDCSACVENMLLKAVDMGLASCYVNGFRIDRLKKVLGLPYYIEPIAVLPVGYTAGCRTGKTNPGSKPLVYNERYGD